MLLIGQRPPQPLDRAVSVGLEPPGTPYDLHQPDGRNHIVELMPSQFTEQRPVRRTTSALVTTVTGASRCLTARLVCADTMGGQGFIGFVLEQMSLLGAVRARRMFGGHGIFFDDRMFALLADDRLYLKVDSESRGEFAALKLSPFVYEKNGKTLALNYFEAPPEVFDDREVMQLWSQKAVAAAARAAADAISAKPKSRSRRVSGRAARSP